MENDVKVPAGNGVTAEDHHEDDHKADNSHHG